MRTTNKGKKRGTINISLNNVSGRKIYELVRKAALQRKKDYGNKVSISDFCDIAGISRTSLYAYNRGEKPGAEGVMKIASGLRAWGYEVNVIF